VQFDTPKEGTLIQVQQPMQANPRYSQIK